MAKTAVPRGWSIVPVTPERWDDLAALFGERGACGGCWCMAWRLPSSEFRAGKGSKNRRALKKLVDARQAPGILGYLGDEPVAWCAVAPRASYSFLARSRVLAPVDESEVWSVTCLFIRKEQRRRGLSAKMLRAAAVFAAQRGARIVEGYPTVPYSANAPGAFLWTGTEAAFRKAGYREAARRSPSRPIMRRAVRPEA
ncbi:MAG TPA: GNAT family N-acetyltransferase [Candidatus Polarisedimenticolia bacterium]|nr:GNAT family N-acetyltransferase [Candidatus Polarisedimenticolia bacterium]